MHLAYMVRGEHDSRLSSSAAARLINLLAVRRQHPSFRRSAESRSWASPTRSQLPRLGPGDSGGFDSAQESREMGCPRRRSVRFQHVLYEPESPQGSRRSRTDHWSLQCPSGAFKPCELYDPLLTGEYSQWSTLIPMVSSRRDAYDGVP